MKKSSAITLILILATAVFGMSGLRAFASDNVLAASDADTLTYVSYQGKLVDNNNNTLPFATVEAEGTNVSTITNIDGEFLLKINNDADAKSLKISYVGYSNKYVPLNDFNVGKILTIKLEPSSVHLQAVTIRPENAAGLIRQILNRVEQNYSDNPVMMKAFYRETIKNRRNYVAISEAVVDIYKAGYKSQFDSDQVKIDKGRKSGDVEKMDTVLFKLQGGPAITLLLDIVKNPYILLTSDYSSIYDFYISDVASINDKLHYVISFDQKPGITAPYYNGKLFVEIESLAITQAEFALNLDNEEEAERIFIQKKPMGMKITPEKALYRTKYSMQNGKWYFNYARAEVKFKVNWRKRLFNTVYLTMSEIAVTDRKTITPEKITNKERFKRNDILDDMVFTYFDPDFWGNYNVIEPDQSIESAIRKLNRKLKD